MEPEPPVFIIPSGDLGKLPLLGTTVRRSLIASSALILNNIILCKDSLV